MLTGEGWVSVTVQWHFAAYTVPSFDKILAQAASYSHRQKPQDHWYQPEFSQSAHMAKVKSTLTPTHLCRNVIKRSRVTVTQTLVYILSVCNKIWRRRFLTSDGMSCYLLSQIWWCRFRREICCSFLDCALLVFSSWMQNIQNSAHNTLRFHSSCGFSDSHSGVLQLIRLFL